MNRQVNQSLLQELVTTNNCSKDEATELFNLPELAYQDGLTTAQRNVLDEIMDSVFLKMLEDGSLKSLPPKRVGGLSQRVHAAPLPLKHLDKENYGL